MEKKEKEREQGVVTRRGRKHFLQLLRAAGDRFFLHTRHVAQRATRRYSPTIITVLTASTIHLFTVKTISFPFERVLQRTFLPRSFLCYLALISAI